MRKSAKTTDVYVPGQGKLAADGNYHMEADGQLSTTLNKDTVVEYIKECEERDKTWTCPLEEGESMVAGCQCFDKESFGQVVGTLQAINMASTNMICSSGENVGGCTPENQGVETKRVVCGDFSMSPSGEVQIDLRASWTVSPSSGAVWKSVRRRIAWRPRTLMSARRLCRDTRKTIILTTISAHSSLSRPGSTSPCRRRALASSMC